MTPILFGIIALELIIISWIDIKTKKISNYWFLANLIIGCGLLFKLPDLYEVNLSYFLFPIGFLVTGFVLFNIRVMGAGDSKLLSSLFLLIPQKLHMTFFENVLIATLITGTIFLMIAIIKNWKSLRAFVFSAYWKGAFNVIKSNFSYAPVITLAWILLGVRR